MKKTILIPSVVAVLAGGALFAQQNQKKSEGEVPQAVLKAFQRDYPNVKDVDWDAEDGAFEAEFDLNKQEISVTYSATGQKQETETEIALSELPANIQAYAQKKNLGKIKEASKIVNADGSTTYEAEVKNGDAIFDQNGNFLKINQDKD
ncbi:PepSY-like domain-containing protein [Kaistella montana]|uniref:PepSY-like domain-containing protein n=1 Tax=Kaistella montana TaxID=1849733 RepID=A0ABW5K925_9FLAO|nr:PepSY-like domain-containing protein [Kaistella montana]MCQ4035502.1 PepSY-like domain-containing protein [Kaistella montana]